MNAATVKLVPNKCSNFTTRLTLQDFYRNVSLVQFFEFFCSDAPADQLLVAEIKEMFETGPLKQRTITPPSITGKGTLIDVVIEFAEETVIQRINALLICHYYGLKGNSP